MKHNGGAAFPRPMTNLDLNEAGAMRYEQDGMTLRDWFAGQALNALVSIPGDESYRELAGTAYRMADEMLTERAKP